MAPPALQTMSSTVSSTTEKAAELSEQMEIDAIWKEVNSKVVELAGGDPRKVQTALDINAVLKYVDNVQSSDKKKSEKFGTFKSIVNRTLQCINTVGGIVADGASTVFAPAGMCYNALTFVIQAWQGYEGIFENLAELLEKCTEFLERLESYEGRMDKRLTRVAVQNLRLFVEICDRTIKLRRKHTRFIAFTKQLFLNDNGIQDLLGIMDRLNAKESLLVSAQTYKLVSDSAGDIKLILDGQKEQKKEEEGKKWRKTIAKALGFPNTMLDNDGEPIPYWKKAFDARKNALVDGTGRWILDDTMFLDWTTSSSPTKPVVVLGGKSGSGKTSLLANTVRHLRKMDRPGPTSRIVTAYYFMEGDKRKPEEEDDSTVLELVSRTLLWQIATSYEAMTKSVYQMLERSSNFDNSTDLWQQLFINNKERLNSDTTFFFFIDGIDETLVPLIQRLTSTPDNKEARLFLAARPEVVSSWLEPADGINFNVIPISEYNGEDIDTYIKYRMDNMPILKDSSRPGISEWREKILKTLRVKCGGDYFKLNTSLKALSSVDLIEDIKEVLADADKTRTDQIDAEIRQLNSNRTIKEIQEINEIIMWIENGRRWFSVEMMEDLLSVKYKTMPRVRARTPPPVLPRRKTGSPIPGTPPQELEEEEAAPATLTISLLPFSQKLAEKYPIFSVTDSSFVDWRSPEIKDRIPSKDAGDIVSNTRASGPQVLQESEISIVRHFLNNVCPPELYTRFDFEQFFSAKLGAGQKEYICLDPENADIRIVLTCLIILTEVDLRNKDGLREYAGYWLLDHLEKVDLSIADRELKAQIGPLLVKLFTDEDGIDSMFWPFDLNVSMKTWDQGEYALLREVRGEWVYSMAGVEQVSRWLHDSAVTKRINTELGSSFTSAVKMSSANLHEAVLSFAAKTVAEHLFRRMDFTPRHFWCGCWFIRGYLHRLNPERSAQMSDDPLPYYLDTSPESLKFENRAFRIEELQEIEAWAASVLDKANDTPVEQSNWEIHGALITFQLCRAEEGSIDIYQGRARKAIELNPNNWHACHFIAKQPNTSNEESVQLLSRAKQAVEQLRDSDESWIKNSANSSLLARITLDLGDRLWELGEDYKLAASIHRESLSYNYIHFANYVAVLTRYHKREAWAEFIAFIQMLNCTTATTAAFFDELVNEFVVDLISVRRSDMLARAADATKRWDVIETFFNQAIDIGTQQEAHPLLFLLRDGFAKTLASATDELQRAKVVAIQETALENIKLHNGDVLSHSTMEDMTNSLAETYLEKAFQPNLPAEMIDSYGTRIANLLPDTSAVLDASTYSVAACCLVRYHHRRGSGPSSNAAGVALAREWVRRIVRAGIELLSDEDEENDDFAYEMLARLLATVEDARNVRITWTLRNLIQHEAQARWENWVTTSPKSPLAHQLGPGADLNARLNGAAAAAPQTDGGGGDDGGLAKPAWFVACDGCDRRWTVMDEPLRTCADCVGTTQLCVACHGQLLGVGGAGLEQKKMKKDFRCARGHAFVEVPAWDPSLAAGLPRACVPLPDGADPSRRWITLDEWKAELRRTYLDGDGKEVAA
ncbi:hypothetical protein GGR52DRAFT_514396 [Hypoxylon sp. FL1284]|nr:hypothetical protein GGR52DRAFT_514396 [Hypoxylon sp. FL1284]